MLAVRALLLLLASPAWAAASASLPGDAAEAESCQGDDHQPVALLQTRKQLVQGILVDGEPAPTGRLDGALTPVPCSDVDEFSVGLSAMKPPQTTDSRQELERQMHAARCVARAHGRNVTVQHPERKSIIWVHLHNYGGTSMCEEAVKQGELTPVTNCAIYPDVCGALGPRSLVHCQMRAANKSLTFSSIERWLTAKDLYCPQMLYGVMLRDPIAAARSTRVNNKFNSSEMQAILAAMGHRQSDSNIALSGRQGRLPVNSAFDSSEEQSTVSAAGRWPGPPHGWLAGWDTYQHFDNFATRTLSGHYMVPPGKMKMKHLRRAKARLLHMDVVTIIEELSDHLVQFEAVFGWNTTGAFEEKHNSHATSDAFTEEEEAFLRKANYLDYDLYAFGKSLAANRTAAASKAQGV